MGGFFYALFQVVRVYYSMGVPLSGSTGVPLRVVSHYRGAKN